MFKAIFIGGSLFVAACYAVSAYARKKVQDKQNPLAPFN